MVKTKKNKNYNNKTKKNLYNISLPIKKKKIIVPVFTKKILKKINAESKCSHLILKPFEKNFEENHEALIKLNVKKQKKLTEKLLDLNKQIPKNIRPNTDYYTYINYKWLEQQRKIMGQTKTYYFKIDSFRVIQDKIYGELKEYLEDYIKQNSQQKKTKNLKNFYDSLINIDTFSDTENGKKAISTVDEYLNNDDLILFLAYINSNEIISYKCPLWWSLQPDVDNSKIYSCYMNFPQLTLEIPIYFLTNEQLLKNETYNKFLDFVDEIFEHYMGKNHGIDPKFVFQCEKNIIESLSCETVIKEKPDRINKNQSINYNFDWVKFTKYLGYKKIPDEYLTNNPNYINCIMKKLNTEWKTPKWRAYWLYIYLLHTIRYSKSRNIFWRFIRNYLQGDQLLTPGSRFYIFGLSLGYNKLLTQLYCDKFPRVDEIAYVKTLSTDLKRIMVWNIKKNTWLLPETKKQALLKLEHLQFVYGTPKITVDDPDLNYDKHNAWDNLSKLSSYRVSLWIKLTGNRVINISTVDWKEQELTGSQAYIVNAFYTPNRNDIFIPQAILQKPFIDLEQRGIEYNLAFIGFTLCHEMSHSLDKIGSRYDYNGNFKNWWKEKDKSIFNKKNNNIIKQYELFAKRDGINIDASISVGENLADINGCYLLTEYLRDFQEKNHDSIYIRELSFKAFFAYFAIQGRQTIYKQALKADIETDPHPLEKYRVNCVLARNPIFKIIYNIKKGDPMYWNTNDFW